ncbi:MAG: hypothetical protein M0Z77_09590 [Thermoplasmatales archaeon]|jgi:hypothetical protein|nr:hypothetical protein [Candidatus Thermoplasmatota archaeon]MCL6002389.1 hypothetical protein [Candidatus Thermoplasmatota archaeon]MDA8055878.1 hypothetical protein [Thermoplasmatales archaeon]
MLERILMKNIFSSGKIKEMAGWFNGSYPMNDKGRRAKLGNRIRITIGGSHRITYLDHVTVKTKRVIDVVERKRKYITT